MAVTKYYTFGGAIRGENQVGGTGYRAYGPDALGSVCQTYDSTGTLQDTFRYSPYGRSIVSTGSAAAPAYLWVGSLGYRNNAREFFEYYVRARHYSSSLSQWTTVDPQWPSQMPYSYVDSSPISFVDTTGRARCPQKDGSCGLPSTCCATGGGGAPLNKEVNWQSTDPFVQSLATTLAPGWYGWVSTYNFALKWVGATGPVANKNCTINWHETISINGIPIQQMNFPDTLQYQQYFGCMFALTLFGLPISCVLKDAPGMTNQVSYKKNTNWKGGAAELDLTVVVTISSGDSSGCKPIVFTQTYKEAWKTPLTPLSQPPNPYTP